MMRCNIMRTAREPNAGIGYVNVDTVNSGASRLNGGNYTLMDVSMVTAYLFGVRRKIPISMNSRHVNMPALPTAG